MDFFKLFGKVSNSAMKCLYIQIFFFFSVTTVSMGRYTRQIKPQQCPRDNKP